MQVCAQLRCCNDGGRAVGRDADGGNVDVSNRVCERYGTVLAREGRVELSEGGWALEIWVGRYRNAGKACPVLQHVQAGEVFQVLVLLNQNGDWRADQSHEIRAVCESCVYPAYPHVRGEDVGLHSYTIPHRIAPCIPTWVDCIATQSLTESRPAYPHRWTA